MGAKNVLTSAFKSTHTTVLLPSSTWRALSDVRSRRQRPTSHRAHDGPGGSARAPVAFSSRVSGRSRPRVRALFRCA